MGTYNIPRNTKGEGRLFYIFSKKALIYTVGGILIGVVLRWLLQLMGNLLKVKGNAFSIIGIILIVLLALLGFVIGTFKVPKNDRFEITKKAGGIDIDKVIIESIKFRFNRHKLYVYDVEELKREEIEKEIKEEEEKEAKEQALRDEQMEMLNRNRRGYIK